MRMKNINGFLKMALGGCLACGVASATTFTYDFTGTQASNDQYSNSSPYSVGACTDGTGASGCATGSAVTGNVTTYALSNDGGTNTGSTNKNSGATGSLGTLVAATLGQYTGLGLGVCNNNEGGAGCGSPQHQVDNNNGADDFVLFVFSTPVNISSISLVQYANDLGSGGSNDASNVDMNFTYWTGSSLSSLLGTSPADGTNVTVSNCTSQGVICSEAIAPQDVSYLLVAASYDTNQTDDFFKISGIDANKIATPEPASFGMIGLALLGLGFAGRRKFLSGKN